jgi:two-component system sensor histidine kinase BaeS
MLKKIFGARSFLSAILGRLKLLFDEKGVSLDLDCDEAVTINADPDRFSQIIINLLSNALKATGTGGRVWIKVSRLPRSAVIQVCDTGKGIKQEDLSFIFERFYRGEKGGLGIGLTIVKELVDAHGGSIEVQSMEGEGTIFRIELPD